MDFYGFVSSMAVTMRPVGSNSKKRAEGANLFHPKNFLTSKKKINK
jgi:hypothetical protein